MKSLCLLRHAKTERDSPTGRDFDRSLDERGQADAERMGKEIVDLGLWFDMVLASPARRAVETVQRLAGIDATWDERIYNATTGELLGLVQDVADDVERLLMVGHNPGFEELASLLAGRPIGLPTGALVELELPIDRWRDAGNERGTLSRLITPKDLG